MTAKLRETIKICDKIFRNCDIDFDELMNHKIDIVSGQDNSRAIEKEDIKNGTLINEI